MDEVEEINLTQEGDSAPVIMEPPGVIPEPARQKEIINNIDSECTCTYAVSRLWHKKWEEYVGIPKGRNYSHFMWKLDDGMYCLAF